MKNTCDLCDDYRDVLTVLPFGLHHYGGTAAFHGPVETVICFEDNSRIKELSATPGAGRVLVVDAAGSLRRAVLGDMIAGALATNGWAGIVIWGAVRDVVEMGELDLGVMALGHVPMPGTRRGEGQIGLDLMIGDVLVQPGAYLVADVEGVVLFPKEGPRP